MRPNPPNSLANGGAGIDSTLAELARLRQFRGPPAEFWPAFLAAAAQLAGAARAALILRDPGAADRCKKLGEWSRDGHPDRAVAGFNQLLLELAQRALALGSYSHPMGAGGSGLQPIAFAVRLQLPKADDQCVAAFLLLDSSESQAHEALDRVRLIADLPVSYQANFAVQQAGVDAEKFAAVLDILTLVNAEKRFVAAALALCNAFAARFRCDRVSLGWLEHGFVRLKAISRTERFDRQMAAVRALEVAMEESLDQDDEVIWPPLHERSPVSRDHEAFAREQQVKRLCSVPLRLDHKPAAVVTCERQSEPFQEVELQQLRLACDQAVRRLAELKSNDRWFGARWAAALEENASKWLGPEHTLAKLSAIGGAVALLLLLLPIFPYRVEGKFILRSDMVTYLTGPFDGYIREVDVRPGDPVKTGQSLLKLDTSDLQLEEASALADEVRYQRESEKARAAANLADMRIAQAMADEAHAHLELVRYRISKATLRAPYDGFVLEGDLRQKIGAPVRQGDLLLRVGKTQDLYVEAEINERDLHEILGKSGGQIAFVSQPKLKFPIRVTRLEPAAFPKENENIFKLRCAFAGAPQAWWRPGMSGVCKINVDRRSLAWVLTHRTVDFLRMLLWW